MTLPVQSPVQRAAALRNARLDALLLTGGLLALIQTLFGG